MSKSRKAPCGAGMKVISARDAKFSWRRLCIMSQTSWYWSYTTCNAAMLCPAGDPACVIYVLCVSHVMCTGHCESVQQLAISWQHCCCDCMHMSRSPEHLGVMMAC